MAKKKIEKRVVKLGSFDEMLAEAEGLLASGYTSKGQWTLGQTCSHLADWMRFPMDGFPVPPAPIRMMMWVMSKTVAPRWKKKIMDGGFWSGMPTAPETVADIASMTDQEGLEKLRETAKRLEDFSGELHPSPLFGAMDKASLTKVSLLHAEHHLGFLQPSKH